MVDEKNPRVKEGGPRRGNDPEPIAGTLDAPEVPTRPAWMYTIDRTDDAGIVVTEHATETTAGLGNREAKTAFMWRLDARVQDEELLAWADSDLHPRSVRFAARRKFSVDRSKKPHRCDVNGYVIADELHNEPMTPEHRARVKVWFDQDFVQARVLDLRVKLTPHVAGTARMLGYPEDEAAREISKAVRAYAEWRGPTTDYNLDNAVTFVAGWLSSRAAIRDELRAGVGDWLKKHTTDKDIDR